MDTERFSGPTIGVRRRIMAVTGSAINWTATAATVGLAGLLVWTRVPDSTSESAAAQVKDISNVSTLLAGAQSRGSSAAALVMIEYSDFECPFCGRFERETLPQLVKDYVETGKVLFVFREMPLQIHSEAAKSANAAECAGRQGHFWQMHDRLFAAQDDLTDNAFQRYAADLKLDRLLFAACAAEDPGPKLASDLRSAAVFGVKGTPTFLFGRKSDSDVAVIFKALSGARPIGDFRGILDPLLAHRP